MFENVKVGDHVKITGKNGDVVQGEVTRFGSISESLGLTVFDETVYVLPEEVDSFEIVRRHYEPGLYATPALPKQLIVYDGEKWYQMGFRFEGRYPLYVDHDSLKGLEKIELPEYMNL